MIVGMRMVLVQCTTRKCFDEDGEHVGTITLIGND